ncbi:hypothetical protein MAXJ12_11712 [Mesorhizobium alhagi CCNWXJ12-2]|uniref:Uncharacterized protein n=1 Tax=Mesorhizobium alhagi CCNWXJ12-2 TaxID=1107882 RepID=H0HQB2_9HYPH|nr:hypothetical protein MAXJ12_11712 [Mesorhizobium alhagi CCNWXJ12-2]
MRNIIKRHCAAHNVPEFKNRNTTFLIRQNIAHKLKQVTDHTIGYVCVDKTKIQSLQLRSDHNLLFNYTFSYLMKEIIATEGGQDINILVDNRNQKVMSTNSLGDYLRIKAYAEWGFTHDLQVHYCDSKTDRLVQVADFVAGSVLERYKNRKKHIYNMLKPEYAVRFPNAQFGA